MYSTQWKKKTEWIFWAVAVARYCMHNAQNTSLRKLKTSNGIVKYQFENFTMTGEQIE